MIRYSPVVILLAFFLLLSDRPSFGQTPKNSVKKKKGLELMRLVADQYSVYDLGSLSKHKHKMHDKPVFRYGETARGWNDGTVWVFEKSGRPSLLMNVAVEDGKFTVEVSSLSDKKIQFGDGKERDWRPKSPAVTFRPVNGTPRPAATERLRGIQMSSISKSFDTSEYWFTEDRSRGKQRFQLRLISHPIWRYKDEAAQIVDGAIFLYCYGTNPEIIGLIEARRSETGELTWHAGFTRSAGADLFVHRNGKEFWLPPARDNRDAYIHFTAPTLRP